MLIILLVLFGGLLLVNGILMIYDSALWSSWLNRILCCGSRNSWFRFNTDVDRSALDRAGTRAAGVVFVLGGVIMLWGAVKVIATALWPSPPLTLEVKDLRSGPAHYKGSPVVTLIAMVPLAALGVFLAIKPRQASRILGQGRHFESRAPDWTWRILGLGLTAAAIRVLLSLWMGS